MKTELFKIAAENAVRAGYAQENYDMQQALQDPYYMPLLYGAPNEEPPQGNTGKKLEHGILGAGAGAAIGAGMAGGRLIKPYKELAASVNEYTGGVKGSAPGLHKALMKDIRGKEYLNIKGRMGKAALIGAPMGALAGVLISNYVRNKKNNQQPTIEPLPEQAQIYQ